ncbi:MAG: methyltransferase domain-containing protein [Balneolaceae bacterium]|nr:methyltransferase domain-containing protein [Balneolaceae bacterium]MCH8549362.1 methyltransferase domain-containing protein [Balneolaceae bacterium]
MTCCSHCRDSEDFFDEKTARRDLKKYRRWGPEKSTRLLIDAVRKSMVEGDTLLDVGGGIGIIQLELFESGLGSSVNVDASSSYQAVSKAEADLRGFSSKTEYHFGDFTEMAEELGPADIVTLDKVICCYPDMIKLLTKSLSRCRKIYGLVYPKVNFFTKIGFGLVNLWFKLRGSQFRTYLHPPEQVDSLVRENGFKQVSYHTTILWQVVVYEKI